MFVNAGGTKKARARLNLSKMLAVASKRIAIFYLHPVTSGSETNALGTVLEREDLGGIDPRNGCPSETVNSNEDVSQSDDTLGRSAADGPPENIVSYRELSVRARRRRRTLPHTINTINVVAVSSHDSSTGEVKNTAENSTDDEHPASSEAIDKGEDGTGGDEEDDVLDD